MPLFISALLLPHWHSPPGLASALAYQINLDLLSILISIFAGLISILALFIKPLRWLRFRLLYEGYIQKSVCPGTHIPAAVKKTYRNLVPPMCQDIDPSGEEEHRALAGVRHPLFDFLDDALEHTDRFRHMILLADSGMGKTTALFNYCVRHHRRWKKPDFDMKFIPLSDSEADSLIKSIDDPTNTVLFLDALDEDAKALDDHADRLQSLIKATARFRFVLISCRTQFFSRDEEIPKETGMMKTFDRRASEGAEFCLRKTYLSPFSDQQVKKYLRRKYRYRRRDRKRAYEIVTKMPDLTARPMLLAHIEDLIQSERPFKYTYELYKEMVEAWLDREKGFIRETELGTLMEFFELLAVHIHLGSMNRKSEKISRDELMTLASEAGFEIEGRKLSERTLLNRDGEGNLKFAHRSIMEYLFVRRFFRGDDKPLQRDWTDRMHVFHGEGLAHMWERGYPWFSPQHLKQMLEHDNGVGLLTKSFEALSHRRHEYFSPQGWDEFRVGFIACAMYAINQARSDVRLLRIKDISGVSENGKKEVRVEFLGGAIGIFTNDQLNYRPWSDKVPTINYQGEVGDLNVTEKEFFRELPDEIANRINPAPGNEVNRAFRIKAPETDIIITLQTSAPPDTELMEKVRHCFRSLP